jgi:hypothetical protein
MVGKRCHRLVLRAWHVMSLSREFVLCERSSRKSRSRRVVLLDGFIRGERNSVTFWTELGALCW